MQNVLGQPHQHSGIGIRRLSAGLLECRVGLDLRLVFEATPDGLLFHFAGNHDEVRKFIKGI
jgi:mRNA-degrading endonuclease YafQ of YafQ-DinJ toxin-antitoxin module